MQWQFTIYVAILGLSTLIAACVAVFAWRRRAVRGGAALAVLMVAVTVYAGASALEAAAVGVPAKIFWSKVLYFGSMTSPSLLLIFALNYAGHDRWLKRPLLAALFILPVIAIGLVWTNESHNLIWTGFRPSLVGENLLIYDHGPAFWAIVVYLYLTVAAATAVKIDDGKIFRQEARQFHCTGKFPETHRSAD